MVPVSGQIKEESSNFELVNFVSVDKVKYGTDGTILTLIYKDGIDTICQLNEIIDQNIFIGNTLLQPHGEDGELIRAQVNTWSDQFDQEQEMLLVSIIEGRATYTMTYNYITKVMDMKFQRESELEDK